MPRKDRRARPGSGSVYWSAKQERYVGEYTLGRDERGKRVRKVIVGPRGDKSDDARLAVKDRLQRAKRPKHPHPSHRSHVVSRVRLAEYLDGWLESKDLSDAAAANYAWAIEHYLKPELGNIQLRELSRDRIRLFFSKLTIGDASKEKIRTVLRSALQDAVTEHELIGVNPAAELRLAKKRGLSEIATWNADQAKRFLRTAKGTEYFPL